MEVKERYDSIDGLRAIAAIGIVCMHVLANGTYSMHGVVFDTIIPFFTNFVFLFMIISGFSMCCGYYEKLSNRQITLSRFYEKRYAKIWPFFATLVILDIALEPSLTTIMEGFADLTLVFALLPNPNLSVIGVGWTLGVIFIFYMLFPFFCFLLDDKRRAWFAFFITILWNIVCDIYFMDMNHVAENFNPRCNILFSSMFFMAGGLIYLYRDNLVSFVRRLHIIVFIFCILITVVYFIIDRILFSGIWNEVYMMLMFSCWLIYAIGSEGIFLNNSIVRFISSISMEIYLCHMVIYRLIENLHICDFLGTGVISYIIITMGVLIGAILFLLCIKYLIQRFSRAWNR